MGPVTLTPVKWGVSPTPSPRRRLITGRVSGGGPFNPISGIAGLGIWIDASRFSSLVLSGSNVLAAADVSGNGNDTAPLLARPIYDPVGFNALYPTIRFPPGSSAGLTRNNFAMGTGNTLTAWFVGQFNLSLPIFSPPYGRAISYTAGFTGMPGGPTDQDNNGSFEIGRDATTGGILYRNGSIAGAAFGEGVPRRCIATIDGSGVMTIYIDGVAHVGNTLNAPFGATGQLQIGNVSSTPQNITWSGIISEAGVAVDFNDATVCGQLDTYLKNKWGLS